MIKIPSENDIKTICENPEIWARITDDTCKKVSDVDYSQFVDCSLGYYVGRDIVAFYSVHDGYLHFAVVKEYRKKAREIFETLFKVYGEPVKCRIPTFYPAVINFAKKVGFKVVGCIKDYSKINNVVYDGIVLERGL